MAKAMLLLVGIWPIYDVIRKQRYCTVERWWPFYTMHYPKPFAFSWNLISESDVLILQGDCDMICRSFAVAWLKRNKVGLKPLARILISTSKFLNFCSDRIRGRVLFVFLECLFFGFQFTFVRGSVTKVIFCQLTVQLILLLSCIDIHARTT